MFGKKYYPGDPCSFHFDSYREKTVNDETLITFNANRIEVVKGTCEDKNGNLPVYENYKGPVKMKKKFIYDYGFYDWSRSPNLSILPSSKGKKVTKPKRLPSKGFYSEHKKTNLYLDIDDKGQVWLTDKTFYEVKLRNQLEDLQKQLSLVLDQIASINDELDAIQFDEAYRHEPSQADIEFEKAQDGYSDMQDELSKQEIDRMNIESEGFWDVD